MACDATARLYDVDEDSVVFKKLEKTEKYDQGTFGFRARKGRLIDLDKLHESIWATRLSGGTRSGLVSLDVTAVGYVAQSGGSVVLRVADSDAEFIIAQHPESRHQVAFSNVRSAPGDRLVKLSGRIDNYSGRWPQLLQTKPKKPRRILLTRFEVLQPQ